MTFLCMHMSTYDEAYWSVIHQYPPGEILPLTPMQHKKRNILRNELLKDTPQCLITGWNNPTECECAHIVPKCYGYNMKFPDVDEISNCCLLSNGLHALFDDMQWTLDIYYFLNMGVVSETSFQATIISKTIGQKSILNTYKHTIVNVPVAKYASFMMHYYAYHRHHYTSCKDLGKIYQELWKDGFYQELKTCKTTSQLKHLLLRKRESFSSNGYYPILAILGGKYNHYQVLWDFYDYSHITREPHSNIEHTQAYEAFECQTDPTYK